MELNINDILPRLYIINDVEQYVFNPDFIEVNKLYDGYFIITGENLLLDWIKHTGHPVVVNMIEYPLMGFENYSKVIDILAHGQKDS